jgi:GT2 family glycosyltransferase
VISLSKNQGIAGNSNEALKLATGEYVGFLDHDDMLAPFTLYEVVRSLNQDRTIDFIYSDEDKVPAQGTNRYDPFFKPEWSPDTFLSYNYLCHFSVVRRAIAEKIGWFREGYDGAQDYDLLLRITEQTTKIKRIPKILYHWRATPGSVASELMAKPDALDSAKRSIGAYLKSRGLEAEVLDGIFPTSYRVKYKLRSSQHVSIIIPTRDQVHLLRQCVSSILEKTAYQDYEILIVDNQSKEPETHEFFHSMSGHERVRVIQYDKPFNYAAINNHAVRSARSPYILFLNNDTEVISQEWLSAMLECAQRDDVGAVGAKLLYPNDTIQHAGVMIGIGGIANHPHRGYPRVSHGYMGALSVIHNVSAVTGACMMVRKEVFNEVGGLNESLSHAYNDVDLCLKMREKGYLIIYTPYAELYHHESASRGYEDTPGRKARFLEEKDILYARWKHVFNAGDPYYSPNLTVEREDVSIKISTG